MLLMGKGCVKTPLTLKKLTLTVGFLWTSRVNFSFRCLRTEPLTLIFKSLGLILSSCQSYPEVTLELFSSWFLRIRVRQKSDFQHESRIYISKQKTNKTKKKRRRNKPKLTGLLHYSGNIRHSWYKIGWSCWETLLSLQWSLVIGYNGMAFCLSTWSLIKNIEWMWDIGLVF